MKKFSKILESAEIESAERDYFTEKDINDINDILSDIGDDEDYDINTYNHKETKGIYNVEIYLTKKKSSNLFDYDTDFLGYTSECINDIQNTISHLRAVGKVYHRIELIQENRYYGGDYTEIYLKTKITIQI